MFKNSDYVAVRSNVQIAASFFGMSKNSAQAEGRRTLGLRTFLGWFLLLLLFSCSVMSDSLQPQGLRHTRLLCPSLSPGVCSNSCPLRQWCHPTIPSCVVPFSSCLQSFPASGSFPVGRFFDSGKYWSFNFNISPTDEYSGLISFKMDWLDLLVVQGTLKNLLWHHSSKASVFRCSAFFMVQLSHLS